MTACWLRRGFFLLSFLSLSPHLHQIMDPTLLPPELATIWNNDTKMQALFASFPASRAVNPVSWDSKLDFWRRLFYATLDTSKLSINVSDLHLKYARKGLNPRGMGVLLQALKSEKKLVEVSAYTSWTGWALNFIVEPSTTYVISSQVEASAGVCVLYLTEKYIYI